MYGHGFCVEQPDRRRAAFYPEPGRPERCHHDIRLCPHCCPVAGDFVNYGAVADIVVVGGAVHRGAGDFRPDPAAMEIEPGRGRRSSIGSGFSSTGLIGVVVGDAGFVV